MRSIEVTLNVGVVAPLLDFIKPVLGRLETETAFAADMAQADRELENVWRDGLIHTQVSDCRTLVGLFGREFLDSGKIELNEENADPVLRAAAAIRLKLRQTALKNLADEVLSTEKIDVDAITRDEKLGFEAFLFLERIQEVILRHLA
ncbi:MAG: hypothetical protein IAE82_19845 [Opitutaceae bacterium]|nr:hypothetical protein [Opitutaceae bacterium]